MMCRLPIALLLVASLASCIGGAPRADRGRRPPPETPRSSDRAHRQCLADLTAAKVRHDVLSDREFGGGCSAVQSVKLLDIGIPVTNLGAMTCPLARNFANWAYYAVLPAARRHLEAEVIRIESFGTYACRGVYGRATGKLSQHAYANAVDISAFVLADGRRVTVTAGWRGSEGERNFLRAIHGSACKRFQTVLGPDYNAEHADHLHMDMGRGPFCR